MQNHKKERKTLVKYLASMLACLSIFSLSAYADSIPANGKIQLHYDNGSKKAEKNYLNGRPTGTWTYWHSNGMVHSIFTFDNIAVEGYPHSEEVVRVAVRYPDENNTIKFKGEAFANQIVSYTEEDTGRKVSFPVWDFIAIGYTEDGNINEDRDVFVEIEDEATGRKYRFPWAEESGKK